MRNTTNFYGSIPSKPAWSYILYLFPSIFIFPFFRKTLVRLSLPNTEYFDFEPGFRFYYGKNIFAKHVELSNTLIEDYAPVFIGEGTAFSKDNKILTGTHDHFDRQKIVASPIHIGKNVWITTNCIVLPGVTIGDNSIIGAGSVVTKDIPANCIAAGNPCKVLNTFDSNKIKSQLVPIVKGQA